MDNRIEEDLSRILEVEKEVKRRIKEIKEKNEESTRV
jgi:hypothetical protein